jgi:hypothetical protein
MIIGKTVGSKKKGNTPGTVLKTTTTTTSASITGIFLWNKM